MFRKDYNFYLKGSSFPKKISINVDVSKQNKFNKMIQFQRVFKYLYKIQITMKNLYLKKNTSTKLNFVQENFSLKIIFNDTREKLSFLYQIEKWIVKYELQKEHKLLKKIGQGGFANVILTQRIRKNQKKQFAVKEIKKKQILNSKNYRYLENEIQALRTIQHKNSLRLYEVYEDNQSIYLVTEFIKGGTLQDRILKKRYISPNNVLKIGIQILDLLTEINKFKLIHRDIKPSNIMFKSQDSFEGLKLIDYGLCANFTDHSSESLLHDKSGTACYLAPELVGMSYLKKFYDEKADVFSIGIILYELLAGFNPFVHSEYNESLILNFKCNIDYTKLNIDKKILEFVQGLTSRNPLKRLSAKEALKLMNKQESPKIKQNKNQNNNLKKYSLQFPRTQRNKSNFIPKQDYYQFKNQKENMVTQNIYQPQQNRKLSKIIIFKHLNCQQ